MRKTGALISVLLLVSCQSGPVRMVYKPGGNASQAQADADQCKIASFREIPQSIATETSGGVYSPGSVRCTTYGNSTSCNRVGAVNIPPSSESYDVNQSLRDRYVDRCLRSKGYSVTLTSVCSGDADRKKAAAEVAAGKSPSCSSGAAID